MGRDVWYPCNDVLEHCRWAEETLAPTYERSEPVRKLAQHCAAEIRRLREENDRLLAEEEPE